MKLELKILEKELKKGYVKVIPENQDDLWILYNIIKPGDIVRAQTTREIKGDRGGSSRRVPMTLTIKVKTLEFQPFTERLRIRGVVVEGPEKFGVKGHYHTINIEIGKPLIIVKEEWPLHIVKRLEKASKLPGRILLIALDYDEATIKLLGEQGVRDMYSSYSLLGGKREPEAYERNLEKYIEEIADKIINITSREKPEIIIIGSPASLSEKLKNKLREKGFKGKIITDHISIGGEPGIRELLHRDSVKNAIKDLSVIKASYILGEFRRRILKEPDLVAYGIEEDEEAVKANAVDKLLINEELLKSYDEGFRRRIDKLLDEALRRGAEIVILPMNTDISMELESFTGILALLRYPYSFVSRKKLHSTNI